MNDCDVFNEGKGLEMPPEEIFLSIKKINKSYILLRYLLSINYHQCFETTQSGVIIVIEGPPPLFLF